MRAKMDPDDVRQSLRRSIDEASVEVEEIASASAGLTGFGGTSHVSDEERAILGASLKSYDDGPHLARDLGALSPGCA